MGAITRGVQEEKGGGEKMVNSFFQVLLKNSNLFAYWRQKGEELRPLGNWGGTRGRKSYMQGRKTMNRNTTNKGTNITND